MLATGFHVTDLPIAEKIRGRDGRTLAEVWADGMVSNRSATVAGFPNLFLLVGPNVGVGHTSMVYMIESQVGLRRRRPADHGRRGPAVARDDGRGAGRPTAPDRREVGGTVWLAGGCASWYLDKHGHNTTLWPDFTFRFRKLTRQLDRENYVGVPAGCRAPRRWRRERATMVLPRGSPRSGPATAPQLHAAVDGADDAPVTLVLAHGWTLAQAAWDDVADLLAPRIAQAGCAWSATTSAGTAARPGAGTPTTSSHRPARRTTSAT